MERIFETHNFCLGAFGVGCIPCLVVLERPALFPDFAGNFESSFIRFSTRVGKEDFESTKRIRRLVTRSETETTLALSSGYEKGCELGCPFVVIYITGVDNFRGLFVYNLQVPNS
jgi:hypothetical protein